MTDQIQGPMAYADCLEEFVRRTVENGHSPLFKHLIEADFSDRGWTARAASDGRISIYGIFFLDRKSGLRDVIYIGQTRDMRRRWNEHRNEAVNGGDLPIVRKMRAHPLELFCMRQLLTTTDGEEATRLEDAMIDLCGTLAPDGCNVVKGAGPQRGDLCRGWAIDIWRRDYFRPMRAALLEVRQAIEGWRHARAPRRLRMLAAAETLIAAMPDARWQNNAEKIVHDLRQRLGADQHKRTGCRSTPET